MRILSVSLGVLLVSFLATVSFGADKVVVVPLSSKKVSTQALAIAWGHIDADGTILSDFGVSSCSRTSTGNFTCTLDNNFSGLPAAIATAYHESPDDEIATTSFPNGGNTIDIQITAGDGTPINSKFNFVVYGNLQ